MRPAFVRSPGCGGGFQELIFTSKYAGEGQEKAITVMAAAGRARASESALCLVTNAVREQTKRDFNPCPTCSERRIART